MKKLPIGISNIKEIITEGYAYVDKTGIALDLIESGKYYFLSRPRRFGKSLFLDTLREIFLGNKELFKGLYIYDRYEFKKYPVIKISFGSGSFKTKYEYSKRVLEILRRNDEELGVKCSDRLSSALYSGLSAGYFEEIIYKACKKYNERVVILIDEYDKPILDNIEDKDRAREIRDELKNFYSIIKDSDAYIRFVFITGVSKFSKVSLFSGLNNLNDITMHHSYATICGYTQKDIETVFGEHLKGQDFYRIRKWYNGYKWAGDSVYNPFDILLFISNNYLYRNYWFSTATPTFLLKLIEKNRYYLPKLETVIKDDRMLDSFDVDNIEIEALMWQTGYLTIDRAAESLRGVLYYLAIPNKEVEISLFGSISDYITRMSESAGLSNDMYISLSECDIEKFKGYLHALYASIPYNNFTGEKLYEYEGYYVSVFYSYIKALGADVVGEDVTNKGRIDITIKLPDVIYVCEFKEKGKDALKQIKEKKYHEKYLSENKPVYLLGIEFNKSDRNIEKIEWEKVKTLLPGNQGV